MVMVAVKLSNLYLINKEVFIMRFLSQSKYEKKLAKLKRENEIAKRKNELKAEKINIRKRFSQASYS